MFFISTFKKEKKIVIMSLGDGLLFVYVSLGILEESCICVSIVIVYVVYMIWRGSCLDAVAEVVWLDYMVFGL